MAKKKIIATFRSVPTGKRKFQKNSKKIEKIEKYHYGFIPSQNGWEKCLEKEKIKTITPFRSFPTGKRKFQKNSKKIQQIDKYHYDFIPSQNMLEKAENERK